MENALKPVRNQVQGMSDDYNNLTSFLDMANYAGNNFSISTGDVGEALQRSGAILANYGVTLDESIAMIVGANESIQDSSKVGTSLKTMATRFAGLKAASKDGSMELNKTAKALKEIGGIEIYSDKQAGEVKDMYEIMNELSKVWDTLTEDKRLALGEAVAGVEHANTFQALMGNWKTVLQYQSDYKNGFTVGSAEKENIRYLDSIEGKWNKLRESLKALSTTIVSSQFAKDFLDISTNIVEGFNKVFKVLDDFNLALPVTIGLISSMGQSFKALSGNGDVKSIAGGFTNFIKNMKGSKVEFARVEVGMNKLTKANTKLSKSTVKTSSSFKKFNMGTVTSGLGKTAAASKLAMVGTSLLNGALIGLASAGIGMAISALDEWSNKLGNAEKEIKNSIDTIQASLNKDNQDLTYLKDTEKRYDELIKKKKEYGNIPLESMTEEQLADMKELEQITSELANMFPELVVGYGEDGRPIMLMADDMDKLKARTEEQIKLNRELLKIKREELAENARQQLNRGENGKTSTKQDMASADALMKRTYNEKIELEKKYAQAVLSNDKKAIESTFKQLQEKEKAYKEHYNNALDSYREYRAKELEIQQSAFDQIQGMKGYDGLEGENLSNVQEFINSLNWANLDETQYKRWINSFDGIIDLANSGSPKLKEWNDSLKKANDEYAATGNAEKYKDTLSGLAKVLSEELDIDYSTVFLGLQDMIKPLSESEKKLNSFLETFGKTRYDLLNGDSLAEALAEQFQAVDDVVNKMFLNRDYAFKANGALTFDMMVDISNKEGIPDQIRKLASEFAKDGVLKSESDLMFDIMMAINSGDKEKVETTIKNVNTKLKELGMEEHTIDIKTLFDSSGIDEAEKKVDGVDKKGAKVEVKTEGAKEAKKEIEEVKTTIETTDGKTVEVKTDSKQVLDSIKDIETLIKMSSEVKDGKYKLDIEANTQAAVENLKALENGLGELSNKLGNIPASTVTIHTSLAAKNLSGLMTRIDQTKTAIGGLNGKTISIITALAAKNLSGLIVRVNQYKTAIDNVGDKTFNTHTAVAAQNISGLIRRIQECNNIKPSDIKFTAYTATASKKITDLINKIKSVPTSKTTTFTVKQVGATPNSSGSRSTFNTGTMTQGVDTLNDSDISLMRDAFSSVDIGEVQARVSSATSSATKLSPQGANTINQGDITFNSPLIEIKGNVDNKTMPDLKKAMESLKKDILNTVKNGDIRKNRLEGRIV